MLMSNTCTQRSGFQQKLIIGIRLKSDGELRKEGEVRRNSSPTATQQSFGSWGPRP